MLYKYSIFISYFLVILQITAVAMRLENLHMAENNMT